MEAPILNLPSRLKKIAFIAGGVIFLLLGIIGIFLPLMPTTPFLLLSAFCLNRGSKRFHTWLLQHRLFGPPIRDWERGQVIRRKIKVVTTLMVSGSIILIYTRAEIPWFGKALFLLVSLSSLAYVWTRNEVPGS